MSSRKTRKAFLRRFSTVMAVLMLMLTSGGVFTVGAVENETVAPRHELSQKDVVVVGNIDNFKAQLIINAINGESVQSKGVSGEITPNGNILCIFGHSTAKAKVYVTDHLYYSTAPKCKETEYDVTYCTRSGCDYINYVSCGSYRVYCCS